MKTDVPLSLLPSIASLRFDDGTEMRTTYSFWRYMMNTKKIRTYKKGSFFRMIPADELERLTVEKQDYHKKKGIIVIHN